MTNAQRNSASASRTIAAVGGRQAVLPFIAMGAAVVVTADPDNARKAVLDFVEKGHPIILVSEDLICELVDILDRFSPLPVPVITSIPGRLGMASFTDKRIRKMIRQAIGFNPSVLENL